MELERAGRSSARDKLSLFGSNTFSAYPVMPIASSTASVRTTGSLMVSSTGHSVQKPRSSPYTTSSHAPLHRTLPPPGETPAFRPCRMAFIVDQPTSGTTTIISAITASPTRRPMRSVRWLVITSPTNKARTTAAPSNLVNDKTIMAAPSWAYRAVVGESKARKVASNTIGSATI